MAHDKPADNELQQKVQDHMDVIVDESAAIVDDVMDEVRKDKHVQEAEEFHEDVKEIVNNTMDDIHEHFDEEETENLLEEETEDVLEEETEAAQVKAEEGKAR